MIAGWMAFGIAVAALLGGAAWALERGLRTSRIPVRWIWALAMAASVSLPPALLTMSAVGGRGEAGATPVPAGEMVFADPAALGAALPADPGWGIPLPESATLGLALVWGVASLTLLLLFAVSAARVSRMSRRWRTRRISGRPILVSSDLGPAVVGVRRPRIVLPGWLLQWERKALDLVLAHEEEHVEARDTLLLAGGLTALAVAPWNLPLWWQFRRLRTAVELDCDARVLSRGVKPAEYGTLLLEMGKLKAKVMLPAAAVAEPASMLERRLKAMTMRGGRRNGWAALAGLVVASGLVVVACEVPPPTELADMGAAGDPLFTVVEVMGPSGVARRQENRKAEAVERELEYRLQSAAEDHPALRDTDASGDVAFGPAAAEAKGWVISVRERADPQANELFFGPSKQLEPAVIIRADDQLVVGEQVVSLQEVVAAVEALTERVGERLRVVVRMESGVTRKQVETVARTLEVESAAQAEVIVVDVKQRVLRGEASRSTREAVEAGRVEAREEREQEAATGRSGDLRTDYPIFVNDVRIERETLDEIRRVEIDRVEVLKGSAAAAEVPGAEGVIKIYTKERAQAGEGSVARN